MELKEKRERERGKRAEKRKEEICAAATAVFLEKGIENASINDIAKRAEVGPATVYRHFENKPQIVIAAATKLWQMEYLRFSPRILPNDIRQESGIERIRRILRIYVIICEEHPAFIRFLDAFDAYVVKESIETDILQSYEKNIMDVRDILDNAILRGKRDGTVREDVNEDTFYMSVTHALFALCQKLVLRGNILKSDCDIGVTDQINFIIDMAVKYIEK